MRLIGFDLDGIFNADIDWAKKPREFIEECMEYMMPIFVPTSPFCIITGRCEAIKNKTIEWLAQYGLYPEYIIFSQHDHRTDDEYQWEISAEFKAQAIIEDSNIDIFIESDPKQAEYIKKYVYETVSEYELKIYSMDEFINHSLTMLRENAKNVY